VLGAVIAERLTNDCVAVNMKSKEKVAIEHPPTHQHPHNNSDSGINFEKTLMDPYYDRSWIQMLQRKFGPTTAMWLPPAGWLDWSSTVFSKASNASGVRWVNR